MKKLLYILFLLPTLLTAQVNIVGYIQTNGVANYPTHLDSLGSAGFRVCQTLAIRNNITDLRKKVGMFVFVNEDQKLYRLTAIPNTWEEFKVGNNTINKVFTSNGTDLPIDSTDIWTSQGNQVLLYAILQGAATSNFLINLNTPTVDDIGKAYYIYAQDDNSTYDIIIGGTNRLGLVDTANYRMRSGETVILIAQEGNFGPQWFFYKAGDVVGSSGSGIAQTKKLYRPSFPAIPTKGYIPVNANNNPASTTAADSIHVGYAIAVQGDSITVQYSGLLRRNAHGLTPKRFYYLQDNGTESITPDATINALTVYVVDANNLFLTEQRPSYTAPTTAIPSGPAGGELSGTYPNPLIANNVIDSTNIRQRSITLEKLAPSGATNGQVPRWNSTTGVFEPVTLSTAPSGSAGGFLSGTYPNPTARGGTLTGTGGEGFLGFSLQSAPPSSPVDGFRFYADASGRPSWRRADTWVRTLDAGTITANRTWTLPDFSGTVGLLERAQTWSGANTFSSPVVFLHSAGNFLTVTPGANGSTIAHTGASAENNVTISASNTTNNRILSISNPAIANGIFHIGINGANSFSLLNNQSYGIVVNTGNGISINSPTGVGNFWTQAQNTFSLRLGGLDLNPTIARTVTTISPVPSASILHAPISGTDIIYDWILEGNAAFSPISGNASFTYKRIRPTINTTGTYSGRINGLVYDPILTSVTGATHIGLNIVSGEVIFGGSTSIPSALFSVNSTTRGSMPFPILTGAQWGGISGPAQGLFAYDLTANGLRWWNGTRSAFALESTLPRLLGEQIPFTNTNGQLEGHNNLKYSATTGGLLIGSPVQSLNSNSGRLIVKQSSDLVRSVPVNEGFASGASWVTGSGWAITGGVAQATSATGTLSLAAPFPVIVGDRIQITYTGVVTSGSANLTVGGQTVAVAGGTQSTAILISTTTDPFVVTTSTFTGSLDNLVITRVNGVYTPALITEQQSTSTTELGIWHSSSAGNINIGTSLNLNATGRSNTSQGTNGQQALTIGSNNTNQGTSGQQALTIGSGNTNQGADGQRALTAGSNNNNQGSAGQLSLTTGSNNNNQGTDGQRSITTAINNNNQGTSGQQSITTGSNNNNQGTNGQQNITTGIGNNNQGAAGQFSLTTGSNNNNQGTDGHRALTTGSNNNNQGADGHRALTTGSNNNNQGTSGQFNLVSGSNNSSSGANGQRNNAHGSNNTSHGANALLGTIPAALTNDFSDPATWTIPAGWVVSGGVATATATSNTLNLATPFPAVIGSRYLVTMSITTYTSGTITINYGGSSQSRSNNAPLSLEFTATATTGFSITCSNFTGVIDNLVITEYNTTTANYSSNVGIGINAGDNIFGTAANNVIIGGNGIDLPVANGNNQLNIQNLIWGTGASGTGVTPAGRVSIGTTTADASAIFHVASTTLGSIPFPSMTLLQRNAISTPIAGLGVYVNDATAQRYNVYNGSAWRAMPTTASGGITTGFAAVGDANGNLVSRELENSVTVTDADYNATSALAATQDLAIWANLTSGATDTIVVILPTPAAGYKGQTITVFADDDNSTHFIGVRCTGGLYESATLGAKATTKDFVPVSNATPLTGNSRVFKCMLGPGGIYRWVVIYND